MKILAIRGKNLASLEGEFEIDFTTEPLRSAGIFAITGSTGSGKSTLLDALCLALFDNTPRNSGTAESISIVDVQDKTINQKDSRTILRRGTSDGYAEVDFVSLGGETFRSRWGVRRSRDKIEGSLQATDFRLTNLSQGMEVQGRKMELLTEVVRLIGLTFDQFTRAVLLAQGDFATFLKATQKEKAELLEKLTGTDIYSRISSSIYEKSKAAEMDLNRLQDQIKGVELLSEEQVELLAAERIAIAKELDLWKVEVTLLTAKIKWMEDEALLESGMMLAQKALEEAQKAIEEAKPRYAYLSRIDGVQEIRDSFNELKTAQKQLSDSKVNLAKQVAEREVNALLLQQSIQRLAVCEADQKLQEEALSKLTPLIQQARALDVRKDGAKTNVLEAKKTYEQAVEAKARIEKSVAKMKSNIEAAEHTIVKIKSWFEENAQYKEIIPSVGLIVNLLNDADAAKNQGARNAKTLVESREVVEREVKKLAALNEEAERLNKLLPAEIALLRSKLADGVPCPVCGSLHHPTGEVRGESLEEEELNKAKKRVGEEIVALTEEIEKRKSENVRLQSMIDSYAMQAKEAMEKLNGYFAALPSWQQLFEQGGLQKMLQEKAENWGAVILKETKTNELIGNLKATLQLEQKNAVEAADLLTAREKKYKADAEVLEKLIAERAKLLDGKDADAVEKAATLRSREIADSLAKQVKEKGEIVARSEKCEGVIAQLSGDITKLSERCEGLQKQVNEWLVSRSEPITIEQVSELLLKDGAWLAAEREALSRLQEGRTSTQATLTERLKTLENHNRAEVKPLEGELKETLQTSLAEKNSTMEQKTTRNAQIGVLFANHDKGKERVRAFKKELEEKALLSENWKKLNELFGSADGAKFKVLAQGYTLEALLTYANRHLHELSKRYELQRIPNTLALQVADLDMLGEVRTVHSLSGGESFLISLALALGLSSLSSNRMKVESLFIDEGFGSLDMDTLRVAMDALERLQTQGRKIGVISHVAEMTERITTQIRVIKTSNGKSRIEVSEG